jgi:centrosomal protein POC5
MPQIIDEDTEHFRNRLEHLLNGFKTDAVGEFMSMKRSMLDYQKETIKNDTQRYLSMYEEKHQELLQAKERLITLTSDLERKTMQIDLMSAHIARLNDRLKTARYLTRPFALLYENRLNEKMLKLKMADAARRDDRRLKIKAVNGWRNILREGRREREEVASQNRVEMEVGDIVGRYQKEMEMVREKLAEATRKNE